MSATKKTLRFGGAEYKMDDRPQHRGWAPGNYLCLCFYCNSQYIGDKRSISCADCAYGEAGVIAP